MSRLFRLLPALLLIVASALVHADPPARVGRLALVENSVSFRAGRDDPEGPASINWPISSGALLETGRRGRSEVWVGSTAFRLAPDSQLEFPVLDDRRVLVRLSAGSLAVSIFDREQSADITVETPEGRINFATPGRYRIDVLSDHCALTAQAGQASFSNEQGGYPVAAGQKAVLYGDGQLRLDSDVDQDAFDAWVAGRENAALATTSRCYVSPAMTGYQDLDAYGDWSSTSEYGAVWYPRSVAEDWAPYRFGRWVWVAPWGWTWVDQSPWGFAPFHYGRWVHVRNRWGWVPGSYVARPVYAPALVAWIGNPGWSVTFRSGAAPAVGWFPLAPREVYVPGFLATPQFVHRINGGQVRNVIEIDRALRAGPPPAFAYRALPQAVTIVPSSHLSESRPIRAGEFARHDRRDLERAPQVRPAPAMPPPVSGRPFREERRESAPLRGRQPDGGAPRSAMEAAGPRPGVFEQRPPEGLPGQVERRTSGGREMVPVRPPETPRFQPEHRGQPIVVPAPSPVMRPAEPARLAPEAMPSMPARGERGGPGFRQGNDGRDERRAPAFRENPAMQSSGREMPRQREPAPAAPPQQMRAPLPQPAPAPIREMPRPQPQAQPPQSAAPPRGGQERRRDPADEHGRRQGAN